MFLPVEKCLRLRSRLATMRGWANALTPPPNGRGVRARLDKRDGLPAVHPVRCMVPDSDLSRVSPRLVYYPECEATLL